MGRGEDAKWHYGPVLPRDRWTKLRVVSDCEKMEVCMDGKTVLTFPITMPAANTLAPILGGYHRDGLGFFKGKIRNLRVSHACGMFCPQ
jgi:hypothetical protein